MITTCNFHIIHSEVFIKHLLYLRYYSLSVDTALNKTNPLLS